MVRGSPEGSLTQAGIIRIAVKTQDALPLDALVDFQGELKSLSKDAYRKLRKEMLDLGFVSPVHVWRAPDGRARILDGHQRTRALRQMRDKEGWTVPDVPVVWIDAPDERTARRIVLALTSQYGQMEARGLYDFMQEADLTIPEVEDSFRFPEIDMGVFVGEYFREKPKDKNPDDVPDVKTPVSKLGDLWILGEHRLLCGDSRDPKALSRLVGEVRPVLLATDPPYGVDYDGGSGNTKKRTKLRGDDTPSIYEEFLPAALEVLARDAAIFLWYAGSRGASAYRALEAAGIPVRAAIIWRKLKPHFGAYMAHYKQDHEPCLFATRGTPAFYGPTDQRAVWEIEQPARNELHPTQKPVQIFETPIVNHTQAGQAVLEPFAGSGTQIVAAEQLERKCLAMELDPVYVDVCVARWEQFTGKKAELDRG